MDTSLWGADEPHEPRAQIGQATQRINDLTGSIGIKRVHREITPGCVLRDVSAKGDGGPAAIGFDIATKGGDFVRDASGDDGDRAVVYTCWHDLEAVTGFNHLVRCSRGCDVYIMDRYA